MEEEMVSLTVPKSVANAIAELAASMKRERELSESIQSVGVLSKDVWVLINLKLGAKQEADRWLYQLLKSLGGRA